MLSVLFYAFILFSVCSTGEVLYIMIKYNEIKYKICQNKLLILLILFILLIFFNNYLFLMQSYYISPVVRENFYGSSRFMNGSLLNTVMTYLSPFFIYFLYSLSSLFVIWRSVVYYKKNNSVKFIYFGYVILTYIPILYIGYNILIDENNLIACFY